MKPESDALSNTELRQTFSNILHGIEQGKLRDCPDCTGLDPEVVSALNHYAERRTATAEVAAREAFSLSLNTP